MGESVAARWIPGVVNVYSAVVAGPRRHSSRRGGPADDETVFGPTAVAGTMEDLRTHHYGVTVTDLERAVEFYGEKLGFDVLDRYTVSGPEFETAVGLEEATGRFAHLDAGSGRVELVEYDPEGEESRGDEVNRPGVKHLGFAVSDVDGLYADLPDDVETVSEPQTTSSGTRILFLRDPEDNLVEVVET